MAISHAVLRAALGGAALLSSVAFTVQLIDSAEAVNFNKAQCKRVKTSNGLTRGLAATKGAAANVCVCPSSQSAYERRQRRSGSSSVQTCDIETPQVVRNFNQPPGTPPGEPPGEPPTNNLLGFNPGNHKNVGKATETPPGKTAPTTAGAFGVDLNTRASNGNCCAGGDKGRSNGS
jgi:hypothetical protein